MDRQIQELKNNIYDFQMSQDRETASISLNKLYIQRGERYNVQLEQIISTYALDDATLQDLRGEKYLLNEIIKLYGELIDEAETDKNYSFWSNKKDLFVSLTAFSLGFFSAFIIYNGKIHFYRNILNKFLF